MRAHKIKFISKDKEGVASVVGTIMALLVFLTVLTMFTNTYIPVTMKENERSHMNSVLNEFGGLKGSIDNMIIYTSLSSNPSFPTFQNIDLGAEGIPAFASATASFINLYPKDTGNGGIATEFNYTEGGSSHMMTAAGGGSLELYAPNRYYVQQWIAYENGAVIIKQEDGQVVRAQPGISFLADGQTLNIVFSQIDIIGPEEAKSGTSNIGVNAQVIYVEQLSYNIDPADSTVNFTMTSAYGPAYFNYFNETLNSYGLYKTSGSHFANGTNPLNKTASNHVVDSNTLNVMGWDDDNNIFWSIKLTYLGGDMYRFVLSIKNPTGNPGTFTYNHSYVTIDLAE